MNASYIKFMNIVFIPLVIFIVIYVTFLTIYSIKSKNKKNSNYIYNINFYSYILGIVVATIFLSFSLISIISLIKNKDFSFTKLSIFTLLTTLITFIILWLLLNKFVKLIRKENIPIFLSNKREQKELKQMLNEIEFNHNYINNQKKEDLSIKKTSDDIEIL